MATQRTGQQSREFELLHAADADRIELEILQLAMAQTGSRSGAVFLWDGRRRELRMDGHVVNGVEVATPGTLLRRRRDGRPNGVAFHVAETGQAQCVNDTAQDPHYGAYFLDVGSILSVPIRYQGRVVGVIAVSDPRTGVFDERQLQPLEELAEHATPFLRRAQLHRRSMQAGQRPMLIKGLCPEWQQVERLVERVSPTDAPVLIRGESGTGKELVANAIHFNSNRADAPFVTVNCAAIPDELLESTLFGHTKGAFTGALHARRGEFLAADGGTLFLDEIGELAPPLQAKVLRALEGGEIQPVGEDRTRTVDVRVIAATNRDLEQMRAQGRFRDDLFFRLAVVTLELPPLRRYLHTLDVLCRVFLAEANRRFGLERKGLSPGALAALRDHDFPGNMRELKNLIERAALVAEGELIEAADLGLVGAATTAAPGGATLERRPLSELRREWVAERERPYLVEALERHQGRVEEAAEFLELDRTTLYRLLKKHGIRLGRRVVTEP